MKIPKTENEKLIRRKYKRLKRKNSQKICETDRPRRIEAARPSDRASATGCVSSARSRAIEAHSENKSRESAIITQQTVIGPIGRCGGAARNAVTRCSCRVAVVGCYRVTYHWCGYYSYCCDFFFLCFIDINFLWVMWYGWFSTILSASYLERQRFESRS